MARPLPVLEGAAPAPPTPAEVLAREGWERRFMAMGERVDEAAALYRQLGWTVRLERPTAAELRRECGDCVLALELFRVVYTRRDP